MVEYAMAVSAGGKVLAVIVFVLVLAGILFDGREQQWTGGTRWSSKCKQTRR